MNVSAHTRSNVPPKNKPSVFIVAAPQDTTRIRELTELLLSKEHGANVTVWTAQTPPEPTELVQLSHMNLFVIAVTEALVNHTLKQAAEAIRFAWSENIPVLPVYYISPQSSNPDAKRFYQAVTAAVTRGKGSAADMELDGPVYSTAAFAEVFSRKLKRLILSDAVAEEITRHAFSKQVFLSYRKVDREKALSVMKAIHDLPVCQSLAIWFDDFLVAGRDFNQEIQQQLASADAFLLTVTPSLLDTPNYVWQQEYPHAIACKKKNEIIPVVAEELNRKALIQKYPELPEQVPVWNEEALRKSVVSVLFPEGEPDSVTARQKYLLGMAFLSGIMVEKDPDRAAKFLREAADQGEVNAALQLSFMYLAHIGVARDNGKAMYWKKTAFDMAYSAAAASQNEDMLELAYEAAFGTDGLVLMYYAADEQKNARLVCQQLQRLLSGYPQTDRHTFWYADCCISQGNPHFDKSAEITSDTLDSYRAIVEEGLDKLKTLPQSDEETQFLTAQGYGLLSDIERRRCNYQEALRCLHRAREILTPLSVHSDNLKFREMLSSTWEMEGTVYKLQFNYTDAARAFKQVIPIREALFAESELPTYREGLTYAYYNYGLVTNDFADGSKKISKAIELMADTVLEDPDPHMKQNLKEMRAALKKQNRKPMIAKLVSVSIILIIVAVIGGGLYGLIREILA